tara:strand:+ start:11481 stop:12389 length:909 start_codon:yes stop_codon:yes gene_type:complete
MTEETHSGSIDNAPIQTEEFEDISDTTKNVEHVEHNVPQSRTQTAQVDSELFLAPKDMVTLPSLGKVYPIESSLHNVEQVEVRHLTAADEDILTSRSLLRTGKAIDALLSNCLVDKSIVPENLLSGDKNAILTYLRVSGYGPDYDVEINCPGCGEDIKHKFDMSTLEMNPLALEPIIAGENRFEFSLPSGDNVEFKFLNSAEEKQISDALEKIKKATNSPIDKNITTRLKHQIISVNGETDLGFISKYVDAMPVRDSRSFRKYLEEHDPDVIMKQEYTCNMCGVSQEVDIPITVSFFWPDAE